MDPSDAPIMVCACGKRLRAPGAKPGRVGRCPSCGGTLRVANPVVEESPPNGSAPPEDRAWDGDETNTEPRPKKRKKKRAEPSSQNWDGFVKTPLRVESRLRDSFLYPLWGTPGVAILVFLPPLLWIAGIPFLTSVMALSGTASGQSLTALILLIPSSIGFGTVLGYVLLFLGKVAASSAEGAIHHPHPPDWDLSDIFFGLGRWAWAGLIGGVVGGLPATAYWVYCGDVDFFDTMILAELMAVGAIYALMALLASILYDDVLAANPFTVIAAIVRVGWGYAWPCLTAGASAVVAATVWAAAFDVANPALAAFLFWLFWVVAVYLAMVVLRVMGLFYFAHARELGWFRGRTGWGV